MNFFSRSPYLQIWQALVVTSLSFVFLHLAFIIDFLWQSALMAILRFFFVLEFNDGNFFWPILLHASFLVLIITLSIIIFRTRWHILIKASYLSVPAAAGLLSAGMLLYRWPIVSYGVGTVACLGALYYLYQRKQHWLYFFSIIIIGLTIGVFSLLGGEI